MVDNQPAPAGPPRNQEQPNHLEAQAIAAIQALDTNAARQNVAKAALDALPTNAAKQNVAEQAGIHVGQPSPDTNDFVWRVVVITFSVVLCAAVVSIAINVLVIKNTSGDILLSIFTAAAGFLGGLFAQLPGEKGQGNQ